MDTPGSQTVFLVDDIEQLGDDGEPILDEYFNPRVTEQALRVDNAQFEVQVGSASGTERETDMMTATNQPAWCHLPVVDGQVPAFDAGGALVMVDPQTITSRKALRYRGQDFEMRGDAVVETDLDDIDDHVFILCERQTG